ncbi:MAG: undecaprenyl-diphosphate phosphatase [Patescibacteria group bacterium]
MSFDHAVILALIEGITEFLPISSTGHMILAAKLLNIPQTEFAKSFEIIIQLGAIMAVASIYMQTLFTNKKLWMPLILAFVPTAIMGFTLYPFIKNVLLENSMITAASLFLGGLVLILFDKYHKKTAQITPSTLTPKNALMIGLFQSISVIPGVSRAAATIIGGMITGLSKKDAVEFSFLLALPTMAAATLLDVIKNREVFTQGNIGILLLGCAIAYISALITVKKFLTYVKTHSFASFGVYRIVLAVLFALYAFR